MPKIIFFDEINEINLIKTLKVDEFIEYRAEHYPYVAPTLSA